MVCHICGQKGARLRKINRTYGKGKDILIIEDIPAISCPHCGESYLEAETLHEIERIKLHRQKLAVRYDVDVARFGKTEETTSIAPG